MWCICSTFFFFPLSNTHNQHNHQFQLKLHSPKYTVNKHIIRLDNFQHQITSTLRAVAHIIQIFNIARLVNISLTLFGNESKLLSFSTSWSHPVIPYTLLHFECCIHRLCLLLIYICCACVTITNIGRVHRKSFFYNLMKQEKYVVFKLYSDKKNKNIRILWNNLLKCCTYHSFGSCRQRFITHSGCVFRNRNCTNFVGRQPQFFTGRTRKHFRKIFFSKMLRANAWDWIKLVPILLV